MKGKKKIALVSIPMGIMLMITTFLIVNIVSGWYVGGKMVTGAALFSEPVDGLSIKLYRGYDYDLDGGIGPHLDEDRRSNDLNECYGYLSKGDEVTGIIDNNFITYRIVINNESSYELGVDPYFIYEKNIKQNSILYSIESVTIYNHTMRNQDGSIIIDYETRSLLEDKTYTTYSLSNGLFDTYGEPIYNISDGNNLYSFTYSQDKTTKKYSCTSVKQNGIIVQNSMVDLTNYYPTDIYQGTTRLTSGSISSATSKSGASFNYLDNSVISSGVTYNSKMIPSYTTFPRKNMSEYMHEENYSTEITIESYSEYYIDIVLKSDSSVSSIYSALEKYVETYEGTYNEEKEEYEFADANVQEEFDDMYRLYDEKTTNSSLSKLADETGSISFKIKYFCFDVKIGTEDESYKKPSFVPKGVPEVTA